MGKLVKILLVLVILLGGAYSGLWFYRAGQLKEHVQKNINEAKTASTMVEGADFTVSDVDVTGFPMSFDVVLGGITLNADVGKLSDMQGMSEAEKAAELSAFNVDKLDIAVNGNLTVSFPLFAREISVYLPAGYRFDSEKNGEKSSFELKFRSEPKITVNGKKMLASYMLNPANDFGQGFKKGDVIIGEVTGFDYRDAGGEFIDATSNTKWVTYEGMDFGGNFKELALNEKKGRFYMNFNEVWGSDEFYEWDRENTIRDIHALADQANDMGDDVDGGSAENISANLRELLVSYVDYTTEINKKSGSSSVNIDISAQGSDPINMAMGGGKKKFSIDVKQFAMASDLAAINNDAKITMNEEEDPMPYGYLRLGMTNYRVLFDYYVTLYNLAVQANIQQELMQHGMFIPMELSAVTPETMDKFYDFLSKVATISNDGKDMEMVFKRDKGGEFYIGEMPAMQVMMLYGQTFPQEGVGEGMGY